MRSPLSLSSHTTRLLQFSPSEYLLLLSVLWLRTGESWFAASGLQRTAIKVSWLLRKAAVFISGLAATSESGDKVWWVSSCIEELGRGSGGKDLSNGCWVGKVEGRGDGSVSVVGVRCGGKPMCRCGGWMVECPMGGGEEEEISRWVVARLLICCVNGNNCGECSSLKECFECEDAVEKWEWVVKG